MKQALAITLFSFALLLGLPCMAGSGTQFAGTGVGPIPDGIAAAPESYGQPLDITFNVTGLQGTVSDARFTFTPLHTYVGDLRVNLIAPNGKRHLVFARTGATTASSAGFGSDFNFTTYGFSDAATNSWWTAASTSPIPAGQYRTAISGGAGVTAPAANTSISASFAGIPPNGIWTLRFEDGYIGDTGIVQNAFLILETAGSDFTVTNNSDSATPNNGSLRDVLTRALAAGSGNHITFASPFFDTSRTINLANALPTINQTLSIEGPGADKLTLQRAYGSTGQFGIFQVLGGLGGVSLSGMTLTNGHVPTGDGGAVYSSSPLSLSGMNIVGNHAARGGGVVVYQAAISIVDSSFSGNDSEFTGGAIWIWNGGIDHPATIRNSTIAGNRAGTTGGGISTYSTTIATTTTLVNTTIANNTAEDSGGGIYAAGVPAGDNDVRLRNTIVANNGPTNLAVRFTGTITSHGFNLSDDYNGLMTALPSDVTGDPELGPLALNGGRTPTRLLLGGSPAIDAGNTSGSAGDQRGTARIVCSTPLANGSDCGDIGAVEMQVLMVTNANDAGSGSLRDAITMADANGAGLDDILFDPNPFGTPQTISLLTALPDIANALTISGTGADRLTVTRNSGAADFRILRASSTAANVAMSGMTLRNGKDNFGGGILSQAPLSITAMRITENTANIGTSGAGIYQEGGDAAVADSTIDNNVATSGGGGIIFFGDNNRSMRVINSTISDNAGGAIVHVSESGNSSVALVNDTIANNSGNSGLSNITQASGTLTLTTLRNTIVANNSPNNFVASSSVPGQSLFVSLGYNLSNDYNSVVTTQSPDKTGSPMLAPLANNSGPTPTHALQAGSLALDNGDNRGNVLHDQRGFGFSRSLDLGFAPGHVGDGSDIGAFEAQFAPDDVIFKSGFDQP